MWHSDEVPFLESALFQTTGRQHSILKVQPVGGGSINHALSVTTDLGAYFVKWNDFEEDLFEKEMAGLQLLDQTGCISTPQAMGAGKHGIKNFLILEQIEQGAPKKEFWEEFGRAMARLHQVSNEQYGLPYDNHIGKLPQKNSPKPNWIDFFIENRLEVQLSLARYNGLVDETFARRFRTLYAQLPGLLPKEPPALLHGDLWSGNFLVGANGSPYIFDPAVYFGHREAELAFTRLFGGFDPDFYLSYHEMYPLEPGFEARQDIYNLYPLLVHLNLFGQSYLSGIEGTLRRYL